MVNPKLAFRASYGEVLGEATLTTYRYNLVARNAWLEIRETTSDSGSTLFDSRLVVAVKDPNISGVWADLILSPDVRIAVPPHWIRTIIDYREKWID